jgi:serine/threonine protein kinase
MNPNDRQGLGPDFRPDFEPDKDEMLEAFFHEALELPASEREGYLLRACAGDPSMEAELRELLTAHAEAPGCLERPAWGLGDRLSAAADQELVGTSIGPYQVVRLLGEGGMGSVYLAHQLRPLRRQVALKLIKLGMDTREVVARFQSERQALASLCHPCIAAVHDAGITPQGRPYFVMEYVRGQRITEYADDKKLSLVDRLAIFRQVCDAVQHAHQKGIIHRDLKPSNILVTEVDGRPVPKIIDFGVAKATTDGRRGGTLHTRSGQLIGTPGYMSPEQAGVVSGGVDTRSDVYSLGVLLNELLTGVLPYELSGLRRGDDDAIRASLSAAEPLAPSRRVRDLGLRARRVAIRRGQDVAGLLRLLRGDLDRVTLRALEREPNGRYPSASELSADIMRYLAGEPVEAASPGPGYRVAKLISKHRLAAAGLTATVVLGFGSIAGVAWQSADRNQELVQENAELDRSRGELRETSDSLLAACEAARGELDMSLPYTTALIRNRGEEPLQLGEIVSILGVGDVHPTGGLVIDVLPARLDSSRPPLGPVDGALQVVAPSGAADAAAFGESSELHGHRVAGPIPPGGYGYVVTHGPFARVRVDGRQGMIRANDPLGLTNAHGLAALHHGEGPLLGIALDDWSVSQTGLIRAFVAPSFAGSVERQSEPGGQVAVLQRRRPGASRLADAEPGDVLPEVSSVSDGGSQTEGPLVSQTDPDELSGLSSQGDLVASSSPAGTFPESFMVFGSTTGDGSLATDAVDGGAEQTPPPGDQGLTGSLVAMTDKGGTADPNGQAHGASRGGPGLRGLGGVGSDDGIGPKGGGGLGGVGSFAGATGGKGASDVDHAFGYTDAEMDAGVSQSWGDLDGDGLSDLLLTSTAGAVTLLRNQGQGSFDDITSWSGLVDASWKRGAQWADVNRDGRLDLVALAADQRPLLFVGAGDGRFQARSTAFGAATPRLVELVLFDADGDGAPDMRGVTPDGSLWLLLNDGSGQFQAVLLRAATDDSLPQAQADVPAASGGSVGGVDSTRP